MRALEMIGDAIADALEECPATEVLSVLTGAFVGLTVELVRRSGGDPDSKEIKLEGGIGRDITIHLPKANQENAHG